MRKTTKVTPPLLPKKLRKHLSPVPASKKLKEEEVAQNAIGVAGASNTPEEEDDENENEKGKRSIVRLCEILMMG